MPNAGPILVNGSPLLYTQADVDQKNDEIELLRRTLRDARDMAVGWMLTTDRLTVELALENVRGFDAILRKD